MSNDPLLPSDSTPPPVPPSENPTTPFAPTNPQETSVGLAPNVEAGLCAVFTPLAGIIFLVLEKKNAFVRFWAMQTVFLGVAFFILTFVLGYISLLLTWLANLAFLVIWIITIVQAFSGKTWELPVLGKMAREQLGRMPPPR